MIPIQTNINGYSGRPCTLFSAYNEETRTLVVSVESNYKRERREGCFLITNDPNMERDCLFEESGLHDSIVSFYAMESGVASDGVSSRLVFSDRASRSNPNHSIEKDSLDSKGQKFRLSEGVTCAHIATLATCLHTNNRFGNIEKVLNMADEILDLESLNMGGILTI